LTACVVQVILDGLLAEFLFERLGHDHQLADRFRRLSGFRDGVVKRFLGRAQPQHFPERQRIDIVHDEQPRMPFPAPPRLQVVVRWIQGGIQRGDAQRGPANPEHHQILVPEIEKSPGGIPDLADCTTLLVQVIEAILFLRTLLLQDPVCRQYSSLNFAKLLRRYAM